VNGNPADSIALWLSGERSAASGIQELSGKRVIKSPGRGVINIYCRRVRAIGDDQEVQHMEEGYTKLGTVLTDQCPANSEGDGVIVVGRFKGDPYDGVQLSYDAGRRNLYLTPEGALRLAFLLAAAVERDIDIR
jgi:hypothetical protein